MTLSTVQGEEELAKTMLKIPSVLKREILLKIPVMYRNPEAVNAFYQWINSLEVSS